MDPNITQEFIEFEWLANEAQALNQGWAGLTDLNAFRRFDLNPQIQKRKVYGYIWIEIATNNATASVQVMLRFYYKHNLVFSLPLRYWASTGQGSTDGGYSHITGLVNGGIPAADSLIVIPTFALNDPTTVPSNPESTDAIVLQPRHLEFQADRCDLDFTPDAGGFGGGDTDNFRLITVITSQ
jgi:hypothetical protein